jgi:hypothetical protein
MKLEERPFSLETPRRGAGRTMSRPSHPLSRQSHASIPASPEREADARAGGTLLVTESLLEDSKAEPRRRRSTASASWPEAARGPAGVHATGPPRGPSRRRLRERRHGGLPMFGIRQSPFQS